MLHSHTELGFVSPIIGIGVFATHLIPRGTVVWVLDSLDQQLGPERLGALGPPLTDLIERYSFASYAAGAERVLCWDHGRYVNHSCLPNCMGPPDLEFEVALRDIQPGEQLTDDYAVLQLEKPFRCACGTPRCRGVVSPHDARDLGRSWDLTLRAAIKDSPHVAQPLRPLFSLLEGAEETLMGATALSTWSAWSRRAQATAPGLSDFSLEPRSATPA